MPVAINPKAMLATLEQRPAGTTNKRHRTVLAVVREHARLKPNRSGIWTDSWRPSYPSPHMVCPSRDNRAFAVGYAGEL